MNNSSSKKTMLFTRILPALKEQNAYFSLNAVKQSLANTDIELADPTLREYMSEAMATVSLPTPGEAGTAAMTSPSAWIPSRLPKLSAR